MRSNTTASVSAVDASSGILPPAKKSFEARESWLFVGLFLPLSQWLWAAKSELRASMAWEVREAAAVGEGGGEGREVAASDAAGERRDGEDRPLPLERVEVWRACWGWDFK